jgi:hypothetical protein
MFVSENKFTLLLLLTIILSGLNHTFAFDDKDGAKSKNLFGQEYFLLDPDVTMIYESTFGETVCTTRMEGEEYVQEFIGDDFKMIQQVIIDSNKISVIHLEQELKILFITAHSINVTYNEPAMLVSIPVHKAMKSEWNGMEYINDNPADTIVITSKYLGNETIISEAGEFDCIKLAYVITKTSGKINKYYEWRAPNVGLVQLTAEMDQKGFVGLMTKILGYDEIVFKLKKIES